MKRPLRVTKSFRKVYETIKSNPGLKSDKISAISGVHITSVTNYILFNQQLGLVTRIRDKDRMYKCYVTDADIEVVHKKQEIEFKKFVELRAANEPIEIEDDELLDSLQRVTLKVSQINFIKANIDMPRSQLAEKIGVSKLKLNMALEKMKS
ncbi:MAG TPA: hypothetical protein IAA29_06590 [Candidatus Paenibacillus intestinavium]|nr:hypothetical protein [Candidatus Paenibacillus intestinavium]